MALPQDLKNPDKIPLEVAVFGADNAIRAQHAGVQRIELNRRSSYKAGGITPDIEELQLCKPTVKVPIRVMIRPRGAPHKCAELDFVYKPGEKSVMRGSVIEFKRTGLMNPITGDGFVFGALVQTTEDEKDPTAGYAVDMEFCKELVKLAKPFPCIFHRAFDQIAYSSDEHAKKGLRDIEACGFKGVLTSGGLGGSYWHHFKKLDALRCAMDRDPKLDPLQLIVGGGLRSSNVDGAVEWLGTHNKGGELWLHSAAVKGGNEDVDYVKPQTDSSSGNEASPCSDSDWQRRKQADKKAQKAAREVKLALLAKPRYEGDEVQGPGSDDDNDDVNTDELTELLSRLALAKPV